MSWLKKLGITTSQKDPLTHLTSRKARILLRQALPRALTQREQESLTRTRYHIPPEILPLQQRVATYLLDHSNNWLPHATLWSTERNKVVQVATSTLITLGGRVRVTRGTTLYQTITPLLPAHQEQVQQGLTILYSNNLLSKKNDIHYLTREIDTQLQTLEDVI